MASWVKRILQARGGSSSEGHRGVSSLGPDGSPLMPPAATGMQVGAGCHLYGRGRGGPGSYNVAAGGYRHRGHPLLYLQYALWQWICCAVALGCGCLQAAGPGSLLAGSPPRRPAAAAGCCWLRPMMGRGAARAHSQAQVTAARECGEMGPSPFYVAAAMLAG